MIYRYYSAMLIEFGDFVILVKLHLQNASAAVVTSNYVSDVEETSTVKQLTNFYSRTGREC